MQTFLPYPNFQRSARVLDNKRLGKQRVEALQLLHAITDPSYGWQNHPATRMWRNYSACLAWYGITVCTEWQHRGFLDTCQEKILTLADKKNINFQSRLLSPGGIYANGVAPPWLGREDFHASHRAALLAKDYAFYSQYNWSESPRLEYVWP